jgi:hypothetical protein
MPSQMLQPYIPVYGTHPKIHIDNANKQQDQKAILFLREAGATVSNSYQVTVMNYTEKFDTTELGNIFTAAARQVNHSLKDRVNCPN